MATARARGSSVADLDRHAATVGQPDRVGRLRAGLGDQPGHRPDQRGSRPAWCRRRSSGCSRIAAATVQPRDPRSPRPTGRRPGPARRATARRPGPRSRRRPGSGPARGRGRRPLRRWPAGPGGRGPGRWPGRRPGAGRSGSSRRACPSSSWRSAPWADRSRIQVSRAASSSGQSGGVCSTDSSSSPRARISRTPSRWIGSPECEAQTSARCSPARSSPARSMPTACSGFSALRGYIGANSAPNELIQPAVGIGDRDPAAVHALDVPVAYDLDQDRIRVEGVAHAANLCPSSR